MSDKTKTAVRPINQRAMMDFESQYISACRKLYRDNTGNTSPFENFFMTLALRSTVRVLTPEDVARELDNFREEWEQMRQSVQRFIEAYPDVIVPKKAPVSNAS